MADVTELAVGAPPTLAGKLDANVCAGISRGSAVAEKRVSAGGLGRPPHASPALACSPLGHSF